MKVRRATQVKNCPGCPFMRRLSPEENSMFSNQCSITGQLAYNNGVSPHCPGLDGSRVISMHTVTTHRPGGEVKELKPSNRVEMLLHHSLVRRRRNE